MTKEELQRLLLRVLGDLQDIHFALGDDQEMLKKIVARKIARLQNDLGEVLQ